MKDHEDRDLVREALAGNQNAFKKILEKHHPLVYSVVRGVVGPLEETEDIVQDVFIKIFGALRDYRGEAALSTWIYRIARNEAVNSIQKRRLPSIPIDDCDNLVTDEDSPETSHERKITRERLEHFIERLDENQRLAIELRYMGEKSYEEIAEAMDIPLGTVKTHIYRAKLSLRRMITGAGAKAFEKGIGGQ
ncbi:MAG: RNA polymerase sigma factor [Candidatus Krumholzibacteria bacterium]|nr:RNA polymerase sigma factor [Candidatus Krumholzibacteria bacterium]